MTPLLLLIVAVEAQNYSSNCSSSQWSYEEFSDKLKISDECLETLAAQWTESQNAELMNKLKRLVDVLKRNHKTVCKDATPKKCPTPAVHSKGGLVCVSANGTRYCKPMCNEGHDFDFLRISRMFETCGNTTGYAWTTQYVGGNKLAICNKSNIRIAGSPSAYFPVNMDCWTAKSNATLEEDIVNTFENELSAAKVSGPYVHGCLMCG